MATQKAKGKRGRKQGSGDRRTSRIAVEAALKGITPIEVMLDNMRFAHESALDLVSKLQRLVDGKPVTGEQNDPIDLYREMLRLRSMAQSAAEGAAPYIHPKYQTINLSEVENAPVVIGMIKRVIVDPDN